MIDACIRIICCRCFDPTPEPEFIKALERKSDQKMRTVASFLSHQSPCPPNTPSLGAETKIGFKEMIRELTKEESEK